MEVINQGIVWGWWPSPIWLTVGIIGLLMIIWQFGWRWEIGLIAAGGLINLGNRWQRGGAVDYWRVGGLWFNLADVLIIIGVGVLLWKNLLSRK